MPRVFLISGGIGRDGALPAPRPPRLRCCADSPPPSKPPAPATAMPVTHSLLLMFSRRILWHGVRGVNGPFRLTLRAPQSPQCRRQNTQRRTEDHTRTEVSMARWVRAAFASFGVLAFLASTAFAQQASITGVVRDASGAVLPGVTVEATSPALIEGVRSSVTDGTGQFRIEALR